jgi:hypothetical protein
VSCLGLLARVAAVLAVPTVVLWALVEGVVTGAAATVLFVALLVAVGWFMVLANR